MTKVDIRRINFTICKVLTILLLNLKGHSLKTTKQVLGVYARAVLGQMLRKYSFRKRVVNNSADNKM